MEKPNPMDLMKMLGGNTALKPYTQRLDYLSQELQRTHTTIQAKLNAREDYSGDEVFLAELRESFMVAVEDLAENTYKGDDNGNHREASECRADSAHPRQ